MDYDISHYTDSELLDICGLDSSSSPIDINTVTEELSNRYEDTDTDLAEFFSNIRDKFSSESGPTLQNIVSGQERRFQTIPEEIDEANARSSFQKNIKESVRMSDRMYQTRLAQAEKPTRPNAIERQDLTGITTTNSVPYKPGVLNPTLKTTTKRLLNIDSRNRTMPGGLHISYPDVGCSTNYTINLSETLKDVQSLTMHSYEIPTSWSTIDEHYGNDKIIIIPYVEYYGFISSNVNQGFQPLAVPNIYYMITFPSGSPNLAKINEYLSTPEKYWEVYDYTNNNLLGLAQGDYMPSSQFYAGVTTEGYIKIECIGLPISLGFEATSQSCSSTLQTAAHQFSGEAFSNAIQSISQNNITTASVQCLEGTIETYQIPTNADGSPLKMEDLDSAVVTPQDLNLPELPPGCEIISITHSPVGAAGNVSSISIVNGVLALPDIQSNSKYWKHCGYSLLFWDTGTSLSHTPEVGDQDLVAALKDVKASLPSYLPSFQRSNDKFEPKSTKGEMDSSKYQNSMGWILGFRDAVAPVGLVPAEGPNTITATNTIVAPAWSIWAPDDLQVPLEKQLSGCEPDDQVIMKSWKLHDDINYVYVILKDYNKNVASKSVVNALPLQTVVDMPSYAKAVTGTLQTALAQSFSTTKVPFPLNVTPDNPVRGVVMEDSNNPYSAAKGIYDFNDGLTKKQLYTLASIRAARQNRTTYSVPNATNSSDVMARIPTRANNSGLKTQNDKVIVGYGSNLSVSERKYFGPVDISRLTVQLMDPYGNILNLHNRDWSFTLRVEHLYQF